MTSHSFVTVLNAAEKTKKKENQFFFFFFSNGNLLCMVKVIYQCQWNNSDIYAFGFIIHKYYYARNTLVLQRKIKRKAKSAVKVAMMYKIKGKREKNDK